MLDRLRGLFSAEKAVPFKEVSDFLRSRPEISQSLAGASRAAGAIAEEFASLERLLAEMKSEEKPDYSNVVKNRFCDRSLEIISQLDKPDSRDYESLTKFLDDARRTINSIGELNIKELRHLYSFKAGMDKIASQIKLIVRSCDRLESLLASEQLKKYDRIEKKIALIDDSSRQIEGMLRQIELTEQEIRSAESAVARKRLQLEEHMRREEFLNMDIISAEINRCRKERDIIKQKIVTELGGMDRIAKKFQHKTASGDQLLKDYIKDPEEAFLKDEDMRIRAILSSLVNMINMKKIELEKKEADKVFSLFRSISFLSVLRGQYFAIEKNIDKLKGDMPLQLVEDKKRYEEEIRTMEKAATSLRKAVEDIIAKKSVTERELLKEKACLADMLRAEKIIVEFGD